MEEEKFQLKSPEGKQGESARESCLMWQIDRTRCPVLSPLDWMKWNYPEENRHPSRQVTK